MSQGSGFAGKGTDVVQTEVVRGKGTDVALAAFSEPALRDEAMQRLSNNAELGGKIAVIQDPHAQKGHELIQTLKRFAGDETEELVRGVENSRTLTTPHTLAVAYRNNEPAIRQLVQAGLRSGPAA